MPSSAVFPDGFLSANNLSAVTTGTGNGVALPGGLLVREVTMVVRGSAGISAGAVQLEATIDGTNWFAVGAAVTAVASTNVGQTATVTARAVRTRVSTTVVGGTVSTDLLLCDVD